MSEWIPVKEKLPEKQRECICIGVKSDKGVPVQGHYFGWLIGPKPPDYSTPNWGWVLYIPKEVENPIITHWMYLPEYPEEVF